MLQIKELSYRYEGRNGFTLNNINLELARGEMLLLAGKSGCGKSTLIKAVSGLLSKGGGEIHGTVNFDGQAMLELSPEAIGLVVGTVYQSPDDQLFAMTVFDEVSFALENQGLAEEEISARVVETLALVGLEDYSNSSIHKLSGGQRQRLALASILVTKPKLLILDEPVSQMNPQGVRAFMELLTKLNREEKISILMVEHRVNELFGYFSRLAVMDEGCIIYDGSMSKAWYALTDVKDSGLREPQTVKLCRGLQLSCLAAEHETVVKLIREDCQVCGEIKFTENEEFASGDILLQVDKLNYTYPGASTPALHDIAFALYGGQITALMGYNGAGKSTLLDIIGGLKRETSGKVLFLKNYVRDALGQIGYLRQESDLMLLTDTVREELCWQNKHITDAEVEAMLTKLNLSGYADDFPLALSKGQRLRVVLGAMLARHPRLLLLDEPTAGQDEKSLEEIKKLLLDFRADGGSVFICTHDIELAAEISDRVIVMNRGRIIAAGPPRRVLCDEEILCDGGLTRHALLNVCQELDIPKSITVQEVMKYVGTSVMGGR